MKPKIKLIGTKIYKGKKRCRACEKARNKKLAKAKETQHNESIT